MRGALQTLITSIAILSVGILSGTAEATQCDDFYPGARVGPPPEWTFWADGSACFVRWVPENPAHEEQLLQRCRKTQGARFVHFEPDKGAGHSICIYKVADITRAFANITRAFAARTRDELIQGEPVSSDQGGAHAHALAAAGDSLGPDDRVIANEPAATQLDDADPDRVAATAVCSSTALGDYKHCLAPAQSAGKNQFAYGLKPGCTSGAVAAVSTLDQKGRCVRRVILLRAETPAIVQSYGGSRVIDAIAFQDGLYACYARRHENVSCDGKTDYGRPKTGRQTNGQQATSQR